MIAMTRWLNISHAMIGGWLRFKARKRSYVGMKKHGTQRRSACIKWAKIEAGVRELNLGEFHLMDTNGKVLQ